MCVRPLIVWSKADARHMSGFQSCDDLVDRAELGAIPLGNWPVAYMRCAHYTWGDELVPASVAEYQLRERGTIIVNSVSNRIRTRKDYCYPLLAAAGVPVPVHIHHPTLQEIRYMLTQGLSWPFIHRSADGSRGRDAYLVYNEAEFMMADRALVLNGRRRIAVRFIDSSGGGKNFVRHRAYVLGGNVDMWHSDVSTTWNTQSEDSRRTVEDLFRVNDTFVPNEQANRDAVKAGKVLGLDIFSVDMVADVVTGVLHVVDVNPTYCAVPTPAFLPKTMQERFAGHFRRVAEFLRGCRHGSASLSA